MQTFLLLINGLLIVAGPLASQAAVRRKKSMSSNLISSSRPATVTSESLSSAPSSHLLSVTSLQTSSAPSSHALKKTSSSSSSSSSSSLSSSSTPSIFLKKTSLSTSAQPTLYSLTTSSSNLFGTSSFPTVNDPCLKNNGGCAHNCSVSNKEDNMTLQCSCYAGYVLSSDHVSCLPGYKFAKRQSKSMIILLRKNYNTSKCQTSTINLIASTNRSSTDQIGIWMKIVGFNTIELLLFLFSIFLGGYLFVFVVTKLCFRKKKTKADYSLLQEEIG